MTESRRPGPNARLVGRGRILMVPVWLYILLIGVAVSYFGGVGGSLIAGIPITLLGLLGLSTIAFSRVWVDGPVLYWRLVFWYRPPVRIDQLSSAVLTHFGRNRGRQLLLATRDRNVRLDATNLRLKPLYGELARFIPAGSAIANPLLHKRMEAVRPAIGVSPTTAPSWPM